MHKTTFFGLVATGLALAAVAQAELEVDETVIVTASRFEQPLDAPLASVTVIDREQIAISQAPDLLELLRQQTGIDVARAGGPGGQTGVFMRGSNSNHVLVLVDGVRVAASGTGAFTWEIIDPAQIERIEIVRGPRAARYGSDAIGGVIQIFTRQTDGMAARAAYGRYRDRSLLVSAGSPAFGLTASARRVGGFSAQNERGFAFDPDDDGFENLGLNAGGTLPVAGGTFGWRARAATGEIEFDQGESDFLNWSLASDFSHPGHGPWQWQVSSSLYRDHLDTETPFGLSEAITRRAQAGVQAQRLLNESIVWLLGVDAWRESGVSRNEWSESRYNLGAWSGLHGHARALDWEASLRVDEDQLFGTAVTGNLAGGWRPADDWRIHAGIGRAFRAPNFSQLYSPGFGGLFAGNPDLDPETSLSPELGIQWRPDGRQELALYAFDNRINDLIDFSGDNFQAINVRKARIRGIELSHALNLANWQTRAGLTWQDPQDRDSGSQLLRRPQRKAAASADHLFDNGGWAGAEIVHTGSRPDVGGEILPAYTLLNLRAGYPLGHGFRLEGRLENATDRDYEPLVGFNAHRRSLFVAISWTQ